MNIVDLKCKSCGANCEFVKQESEVGFEYDDDTNKIFFYQKSGSGSNLIKCPFCGTESALWFPGNETVKQNNLTLIDVKGNNNTIANISFGGSVSGANIVIGNGNVVK